MPRLYKHRHVEPKAKHPSAKRILQSLPLLQNDGKSKRILRFAQNDGIVETGIVWSQNCAPLQKILTAIKKNSIIP